MRILLPKEGQTYLYFYKNNELEPSSDIKTIKRLLKECGCKVGPAWKREKTEYHICQCEAGEFRLVNDVPANYIESDDSRVIEYLADRLMVVCHKFKIGCEVRLNDGQAVYIKDYINEDYIVSSDTVDKQISEGDVACKAVIPDAITDKKVAVSLVDPDFGELDDYEGIVKNVEFSDGMLRMTIEVSEDWDLVGDEPFVFEKIILENEIAKIKVIESEV